MKLGRLLWPLILAAGLMLATVMSLSAGEEERQAGSLTVCPAGPPTCNFSVIQHAVDAAQDGDLIKIAAGTYSGVQGRPAPPGYYGPEVIAQVVYIDKSITLQGGYTITNWSTPYPLTQPTTLDAEGEGRVLMITGDVRPIAPTIRGLRITGGDATGLGGYEIAGPASNDVAGGIYLSRADAILADNLVFGNRGLNIGGVYLAHDRTILSSSTVSTNTGGGIRLCESEAIIRGNLIRANAGHGIALFDHLDTISADYVPPIIEENLIIENWSIFDGAGLMVRNVGPIVRGNTFRGNRTTDNGGGLYWRSGYTATVVGNRFVSNTAGHMGGGAFVRLSNTTSVLEIERNTFEGNTATNYGGGLYAFKGSSPSPVQIIKVTRSTFLENSAGRDAGGFGIGGFGYELLLQGSVFVGNTAGQHGGGLYTEDCKATSWIVESTFIQNQAGSLGGAMYLDGCGSTLWNTLIAENDAGSQGGGLYFNRQADLIHTTIVSNTAGDGSGIASISSLNLTNTILVSHTVGIRGLSGTLTTECTLWGNEIDWDGWTTVHTGTVNLQGDPGFAAPAAGDYHIDPGSVALDVGIETDRIWDLDLQPPAYGVPDLGADEYWPPGALKHAFLPLVVKRSSSGQ